MGAAVQFALNLAVKYRLDIACSLASAKAWKWDYIDNEGFQVTADGTQM